MKIDKPGRYILTEPLVTRGAYSVAHLPAGSEIEITQVDHAGRMVIGPLLEDWIGWDLPVVPAPSRAPEGGKDGG